jgi:uncharacterized protein involved in exopolysaccharide biosynthesis
MADPIDDYATRLAQALAARDIVAPRIVAEAREHLLDMVAEGRRRGLSPGEAERDAFDRFGAPEIVAAHAVSEGDRPMSRLAAAFDTMWQRKWWILVPAGVAAMVTTVAATYLLPTRYRSESIIVLTKPRVPEEIASFVTMSQLTNDRFQVMVPQILSRPRLERIIMDLDLYEAGRGTVADDLVTRMRRDVALDLVNADQTQSSDGAVFSVSFVATDPKTAMLVTARIADTFVEENLRDREVLVEGAGQFIDAQIADTRRRIIEYETSLEQLRATEGTRPLSRADLLPYEMLQESYKNLLMKAEDARIASAVQRRQIGEQFKVIEAARLPDGPVGPSRVSVSVWGAFAGMGVGLLLVRLRDRPTETIA